MVYIVSSALDFCDLQEPLACDTSSVLVWPIDEPLFAQESNYWKGCPLPDAIFASHIVNLLPT